MSRRSSRRRCSADPRGGLQANCYRVCFTNRGENRLPLEEPQGYDPGRFELLRRYLTVTEVEARDLLGLVPDLLPNGECDINSIGPFSLNVLDGSNRGYPDGNVEERLRIRDLHLAHTRGLVYFLAYDESVPTRIFSYAVPPYSVPSGALMPRREHSERLLVPVCLSELPRCFRVGAHGADADAARARGWAAAAQAARRGVAVQDVEVQRLQDDLREAGQVLSP